MKIEYKGMVLDKHCVAIDDKHFYYDYDIEKFKPKNFREDTESKVIARTYRTFKARLMIKRQDDRYNLNVELHKAQFLLRLKNQV